MPVHEYRGLSALEKWCQRITKGYKNVKVTDLSSSWRDGLAFCAIIHHFRPDLIDFDELSKENILHNNKLAFEIAEKHLDISALLVAEDMVKYDEPDRRSVATYLAQFYERFEGNKNSNRYSLPLTHVKKEETNDTTNQRPNSQSSQLPPKPNMKCHKCNLRVFILDRVFVDGKLYHNKCIESQNSITKSNSFESHKVPLENQDNINDKTKDDQLSINHEFSTLNLEHQVNNNQFKNEKYQSSSNQSIDNIDGDKIDLETTKPNNESVHENCDTNSVEPSDNDTSNCQIENNLSINSKRSEESNISSEDNFRGENPFGNDIENESVCYPDDLNPFGDEEGNDGQHQNNKNRIVITSYTKDYNAALNPFGDEDDEDNVLHIPTPIPRKSLSVVTKSPESIKSTSPSSLEKRKKRLAPTPPIIHIKNEERRDSIISNTSSEISNLSRTPTPQPRLRSKAKEKSDKHQTSSDSLNNKGSEPKNDAESVADKNTFGHWKNKKRPAPSIPVFKRSVRSSISEIQDELNEIGNRLPILEGLGSDYEKKLIIYENENKPKSEIEEIQDKLFKVVKEKFNLACRQKELNYMKRQHELEEKYVEIEFQLRLIMSKQASQKSKEDEKKESELLQSLMEIVDERNDIVENMARDEERQKEDYKLLISKMSKNNSSPNLMNENVCSDKKESLTSSSGDKMKKKKKKELKEQQMTSSFPDDKKSFTIGRSLKKLGIKPSKHK